MSSESGHTTKRLQAWLERLRAGDPRALEELVNHAYKRLQRLAHAMLGQYPKLRRQEETGDVLHRAFLRLERALRTVQPASVPEFFGLAALQIRRELIDLHRHYFGPHGDGAHQVHDMASPKDESGSQDAGPPDGQPGPGSWLERRDVQAAVHECVEALAVDERQVVDLLFYGDLTREEAAEALGVSVPTVKRRWRTARLQLGRLLEDRGIIE